MTSHFQGGGHDVISVRKVLPPGGHYVDRYSNSVYSFRSSPVNQSIIVP